MAYAHSNVKAFFTFNWLTYEIWQWRHSETWSLGIPWGIDKTWKILFTQKSKKGNKWTEIMHPMGPIYYKWLGESYYDKYIHNYFEHWVPWPFTYFTFRLTLNDYAEVFTLRKETTISNFQKLKFWICIDKKINWKISFDIKIYTTSKKIWLSLGSEIYMWY